ncbi:MAG: UDP-2,3-diacylglucosamine diphosphatase [Gemmatimonadetes bacterium]|nr:UDP-2,3-diacylglucosamine diphosphatase [Gemmatimonadota bacterium]
MTHRKTAPSEANDDSTILFVSDAHFGAAPMEQEEERLQRFLAFLRFARGVDTLYIVGDLFDFWFEYRQVVPKTHAVLLAEIASLARSGVNIHFVAGNHDFWIGREFAERCGMTPHYESMDLTLQGRRIFLSHGDDLTAGHDTGYRFLRRMVRNKYAIGLYHWIHPDLAIPFARWASNTSRGYSTAKKFVLNATLERAIREKLEGPFDAVVMGHIHYADHLRYETGECLMLGDWIQAFTYLELKDGEFALRHFEGAEAGVNGDS